MSATSCLLSPSSYHVRHCICTGFNASLIRARPALKLQTASNSYQRRSLSECHRPFVTCQQGRQVRSRPASVHNPEICMDEDVPKPVPEEAWQRFAGFLLKSTSVIALALALVRPLKQIFVAVFLDQNLCKSFQRLELLQTFGGVSSAEAARSGGRMGGSSFSAARSGSSSFGRYTSLSQVLPVSQDCH